MKTFRNWLENKNYSPKTIKEIESHIQNFQSFFDISEEEIKELRYEDITRYISNLRKSIRPSTINLRIRSINKYFDYLLENHQITHHPSRTIKVKEAPKNLIETVLKKEQLTTIYESFEGNLKQKVLLGLIIFQGAESGVLQRLEPNHIDLDKGMIYLPSTNRSNSRKLSINSSQLMPLFKYLQVYQEGKLFTGVMRAELHTLLQNLKHQNPVIQSIRQIRSSVICDWLKVYNLREVQYMCGHRFISSTEAYCLVDIEQLKTSVELSHPFG